MDNPIIFIVAVIAASVLHGIDLYQSRLQPFYGLTEKIPLFRDRYKYLDVRKNALWSYGAITLTVVIFAAFDNSSLRSGMTVFNAGFAAVSLIQVLLNRQLMRKNRIKQLEFMRRIKAMVSAGASDSELLALKPPSVLWNRFDRTRYELFGWLYFVHPTDKPSNWEIEDARKVLRKRLISVIAKTAESEWFTI